jgi:uncharacterized membrane protein
LVLRKKISNLERSIFIDSSDKLKSKYQQVYDGYLKLPERGKRNFYSRIIKAREHIEEQLNAEKKIEELLECANHSSLDELKRIYEEIHENMVKLSQDNQQKLYLNVAHLKDQLDRGITL